MGTYQYKLNQSIQEFDNVQNLQLQQHLTLNWFSQFLVGQSEGDNLQKIFYLSYHQRAD